MQSLSKNGYTEKEVKDMLHGKYGTRVVRFRYDLLDKNDVKKGELLRVVSGEVSNSSFSTIKRTAKFVLEEEDEVVSQVQFTATWEEYAGQTWNSMI